MSAKAINVVMMVLSVAVVAVTCWVFSNGLVRVGVTAGITEWVAEFQNALVFAMAIVIVDFAWENPDWPSTKGPTR